MNCSGVEVVVWWKWIVDMRYSFLQWFSCVIRLASRGPTSQRQGMPGTCPAFGEAARRSSLSANV